MRSALVVVVTAGITLSAWWAARVPIFASPDEDVHFDYVASLATAKRPLLASEKPVLEIAPHEFMLDAHPLTWHLAFASNTMAMRQKRAVKVPPGYGSLEFFRALSRSAPAMVRQPVRNPWAISEYPIGYYVLTALWASAWSCFFPGVVAVFFAARSFSVVLLGIGLFAWWGVFRQQGSSPWRAVGLLAVVACFPLTTFVSSYVQPDNLGFAAVPLCLWLAMRTAAGPPSAPRLAMTGLALGLLVLSKYHVFLAVAVPVTALLATVHARWPDRRWLDWGLLLGGPTLLAAELQAWISSGGGSALRNFTTAAPRSKLLRAVAGSESLYLERMLRSLVENFFGTEGHAFRTFWYLFGWVDLPVVLVSPAVHEVVVLALQVGMIAMLALLLVRWQQVVTSILVLWCRGERRRALRLTVANPMLTSYFLFAALIFALYVYTANAFVAQGRHWFPVLPAILWAAVEYSPRALASRRAARWLSQTVLAALLVYAVAGSYYGVRAVQARYYDAGAPTIRGR